MLYSFYLFQLNLHMINYVSCRKTSTCPADPSCKRANWLINSDRITLISGIYILWYIMYDQIKQIFVSPFCIKVCQSLCPYMQLESVIVIKFCTISECYDKHQLCPVWSRGDQCQRNGGYMLRNCQKSCGVCWKNSHELDTALMMMY